MAITNGRNLAELASLINSDGKISAEAFSAELTASIDPTMYDSASDVPFEDAVKGTQVFVPSEGLLIKLTDSDWYSIDGSTGAAAAAWVFQGSVSGYVSGGRIPSSPNPAAFVNEIEKFSFVSDANSTDVGDMVDAKEGQAGQSSAVSGYNSGGGLYGLGGIVSIEKFPFATDGNGTDVGDLVDDNRSGVAGQSSTVSGYTSGRGYYDKRIDKFPFAVDANATDVGDLTDNRTGAAGQSSDVSGYTSGGVFFSPTVRKNIIDKFAFASDGNATDVGDLTASKNNVTGQSSVDYGYTTGGYIPSMINVIDKFPFAADGNATDVGDLTKVKALAAGQQV